MKTTFYVLVLLICFQFGCNSGKNTENEKFIWKQYRGANVSPSITEQDLIDFKAAGGNLIRLSFPTNPFAEMEPPHNLRDSAFADLERVLDICESLDLQVLIDPHRYPGTMHMWTMLGNDPFWKEAKYHDIAEKIWIEIAKRTAKRGQVVAGLDILNEPGFGQGFEKGTLGDINLFYERFIKSIRKYDSVHTIVLAAPRYLPANNPTVSMGYVEGLQLMELPDDDNLAVEVHMYKPQAFTHQGIWEPSEVKPYPGMYDDSVYWDKSLIRNYMKTAYDFGQEQQVPMFVGEFSCPRHLGPMGNQYIKDCIDVFEEYGFSWAYHAWRENEVWDAEMSSTDRADKTRYPDADRITLLKPYYQRNK